MQFLSSHLNQSSQFQEMCFLTQTFSILQSLFNVDNLHQHNSLDSNCSCLFLFCLKRGTYKEQ